MTSDQMVFCVTYVYGSWGTCEKIQTDLLKLTIAN